MLEMHSQEPDEAPQQKPKKPEYIGPIKDFLPEGWGFRNIHPFASLINPAGERVLYGNWFNREEASRVGLPGFHVRPQIGAVVRATTGKLYVCVAPAEPSKPGDFPSWAPQYPNAYEATWSPLPDEVANNIAV